MPPSNDKTPNDKTRAAFTRSLAQRFDYTDSISDAVARNVPVETPINIVYAPVPFAVMMATPQDLEDFAVGFSFTEGMIDSASDIRSIAIEEDERGVKLIVSLAADKLQRHLARARKIAGLTSCGICGIDDLASLPQVKRTFSGTALRADAIEAALSQLRRHQPLNVETGAVHAAAWCAYDGTIRAIREDVGRHNALDKLIGHLLRTKADPTNGFVLITSRCSFELVEKTAVFGASALVAISAPTSLAIERANAYRMTLVAIARSDGAMVFGNAGTIVTGETTR
ncbi:MULTISPECIES: formate dehydrogenase accessory sulfurtransferase FdhD [unclassified Beijerinckia]|uniref:formate dehydrogenase accessory sulfurtransferase FdhD n=1 Tax=unclassified Beijerinckia TaxID=2638183 RepID=UPI00089C4DFC|nr:MULTISPECIES: formate dehydrogenase accessory sulfurtransferase FdhD [unclassified Beijerinckia]MDH7799960.1 FdhD protein [Beijerinckia sp. GAS462]SED44018.1 FdhD protein [Beijerinckia sp. 28-YEA-48]